MEERPDWRTVDKVGHPWHRRKELITAEQIEKMIKEGFSKRQIALYYQKSRGTIYRRLHDAKKARDKAEQEEKARQKKAEAERLKAEEEQKKAEKRRQAEEEARRERQINAIREAISELAPYSKGSAETVASRKRLRQRLIELGMSAEDAARECGYPAAVQGHP
jgi:colicin import membrane protein